MCWFWYYLSKAIRSCERINLLDVWVSPIHHLFDLALKSPRICCCRSQSVSFSEIRVIDKCHLSTIFSVKNNDNLHFVFERADWFSLPITEFSVCYFAFFTLHKLLLPIKSGKMSNYSYFGGGHRILDVLIFYVTVSEGMDRNR